jgi:hypothetical protein
MLNVVVLLPGDWRASIAFLRRIALDQASALDSDGLGNKKGINKAGRLGNQRLMQKAEAIAETARRIFNVAVEACQLKVCRRAALFNVPARAGLLTVRVPQNPVDFRRQQSPGEEAQKHAGTPVGFEAKPEDHIASMLRLPAV